MAHPFAGVRQSFLGMTEAEELRWLREIYTYVVELTKASQRDQYVASGAMVLIHKLLTTKSLAEVKHKLMIVATASLFLVCKVRYMPFSLKTAADLYFSLELKMQEIRRQQAVQSQRSGGQFQMVLLTQASYTPQRR